MRAQNPAVGAQPPVGFEHLVQQFYVSAMIQMGAGTQEGQRPRVDILGARTTIDLLGVLAEKTKGNLTEAEDRTLQTVLFEARMAFLELTSMINVQGMQPPARRRRERSNKAGIRGQGSGVEKSPSPETCFCERLWKACSHFWGREPRWGFRRWGAPARCAPRPTRTTGGCGLRCCCAGMSRRWRARAGGGDRHRPGLPRAGAARRAHARGCRALYARARRPHSGDGRSAPVELYGLSRGRADSALRD